VRNYQKETERLFYFFSPGPYQFRKSEYEFHIPVPDMRLGHTPGQATIFPKDFYCTVKVTSPSCSAFQWSGAYEGPGFTLDIKLPPDGYDFVIEVKYIERGEDLTTPDFNSPVFWDSSSFQYSRVVYKVEKTFMGGGGTILIEIEPTYNQGYDLDANGQIKPYLLDIGKGTPWDFNGLNTYINWSNMNFTGI